MEQRKDGCMDGKRLTEPIWMHAFRLLGPKPPIESKKLSKRRQRFKEINFYLRIAKFTPMQEKVMKAFIEKGWVDSTDIHLAIDSKVIRKSDATRKLIQSLRKRIAQTENLKHIIGIKSTKSNRRTRYHLIQAVNFDQWLHPSQNSGS